MGVRKLTDKNIRKIAKQGKTSQVISSEIKLRTPWMRSVPFSYSTRKLSL